MCNGKRLSGWMALAVFATVGGAMVAADPAFAKVDVDKLTISGEVRERYEIRTNTSFLTEGAGGAATALVGGVPGARSNESAASQRIRVGIGYDLTPDVSFFAQIQDARIFGSESGTAGGVGTGGFASVSSANGGNTGVDLHQGYLQLKNLLVPGLSLKIGRQEIIYGDQRLLGNFNWSQIGTSFDAAKLMYSTQFVDIDIFAARIAESEATGFNNGVIFPGPGTKGTTDQDLYGAYVTVKPIKGWTVEPYYFLLKDSRASVGSGLSALGTPNVVAPQAADQNRSFLGGRINGKQGIAGGSLDVTGEGVWQFGGISNSPSGGEHNLHINGVQGAGKIGYTFDAVPMRPRLGFEADYASGDNCVNGKSAAAGGPGNCAANGRLNTADNLFPTNHGLYGLLDMQAWRNMVNYQIALDVKPSQASKLQGSFIWHRLARTTDNWYRAGQVPFAVTGGNNQEASLGQELNISYLHTFKEKFLFEIGYGHFYRGGIFDPSKLLAGTAHVTNINGIATAGITDPSQTTGQNWGYVMGTVKF